MKRFKTVVTLLLALLWVPATMHCRLEMLSKLEILSCCDHEENQQAASHHDEHCHDDGCAVVESGLYRPGTTMGAPDRPLILVTCSVSARSALPQRADLVVSWGVAMAPLECIRTWPFLFRTAMPPRAPSFVS